VKNLFGFISLLFSSSGVYYKSYRQAKTQVDNLQSLQRLPIFDKTRLVAFHKKMRHKNNNSWFLPDRENESAQGLDSLHAVTNNNRPKNSLQTDNITHQCFYTAE
jgi:hypothetical protein